MWEKGDPWRLWRWSFAVSWPVPRVLGTGQRESGLQGLAGPGAQG